MQPTYHAVNDIPWHLLVSLTTTAEQIPSLSSDIVFGISQSGALDTADELWICNDGANVNKRFAQAPFRLPAKFAANPTDWKRTCNWMVYNS